MTDPRAVVEFWFADRARTLWFERDRDFDADIRQRFADAVHAAQLGGLEDWRATPQGTLALVLLLDQMARNIHRGEAKAFLGDPRALAISRETIARGQDRGFGFQERRFLYLPFAHSEAIADQDRAIELFTDLMNGCEAAFRREAEKQLDYAHRHRAIILRFGRYPHRNAALGRETTAAEAEFLKGPNSSF
jgi:uncharacterized protein (DUF924 family)